MYFIEYRGFDRTLGNINQMGIGATVLEVWSEEVSFETPLDRSLYFTKGGTASCLNITAEEETVGDGILKYRFALNDQYIDHIYPMVSVLPSDEDLEQMLTTLL